MGGAEGRRGGWGLLEGVSLREGTMTLQVGSNTRAGKWQLGNSHATRSRSSVASVVGSPR